MSKGTDHVICKIYARKEEGNIIDFQFEGSKKITPMLLLVGLGIDVGGIFYLK